MIDALSSSQSILWETNQAFFDELNDTFCFTLDVCAVPENAKCKNYFSPKEDGLRQSWTGRCWMNPPYGKEIGKWVEKGYQESERGALVVSLLPARTDTRWFHQYIYQQKGVTIQFIKGRLRFANAKNAAPFPSMLVIFNRHPYAK